MVGKEKSSLTKRPLYCGKIILLNSRKNVKQIFTKTVLILFLILYLLGNIPAFAENLFPSPYKPVLVEAVMCESIEKFVPINEAVVFSDGIGQVFCFTDFDPVLEKHIIYHRWYHKGILISAIRLTLNPPRWSSVSSMQLRGTDKGPWQVDITDEDGSIYKTLRFSITE